MKPTSETFIDRFWAKVNKTEDCWNWTGARIIKPGYLWHGRINSGVDGVVLLAHRVSYELHYGIDPGSLCVLHTCDNPACVNPGHLWLGTNLDNVRDRMVKDRSHKPMRIHCRKGHRFTAENTLWQTSPAGRPTRRCRQCRVASHRPKAMATETAVAS